MIPVLIQVFPSPVGQTITFLGYMVLTPTFSIRRSERRSLRYEGGVGIDMNGNHDLTPVKEASPPSGSGIRWNEFSRELVECFTPIKPTMFFFSGVGTR